MRRFIPKLSWASLSYERDVKIDHHAKRLRLLADSARPIGFIMDREGAIRYHDPDVQWLNKRGYIRIYREEYADGWAKDLKHPYKLKVTKATITSKGKAALEKGKI